NTQHQNDNREIKNTYYYYYHHYSKSQGSTPLDVDPPHPYPHPHPQPLLSSLSIVNSYRAAVPHNILSFNTASSSIIKPPLTRIHSRRAELRKILENEIWKDKKNN